MKYQRLRGMKDIFDSDARLYQYIERLCEEIFSRHNYHKIFTPVLETTELFLRGIGDGTDIVNKEMYTFKDRGDRMISLRPEGTAGVIRAIIENKLLAVNESPYKVFYSLSCYRYERPQEGRLREFRQIGAEIIGVNNAYTDIELIMIISNILTSLKIGGVEIRLNTLGDKKAQENYRNALREFLKNKIDTMCPDCQKRYQNNVLRVLDCKEEKDQQILLSAPVITDFVDLNDKQRLNLIEEFFQNSNQIKIVLDPHLVRGLDYYSHTVFEVHATNEFSSLGALAGGGCYDHLVKEISGNTDAPGSGFSLGLDRLFSVVKNCAQELDNVNKIYFAPLSEKGLRHSYQLLLSLQKHALHLHTSAEVKSLKQHLKSALRNECRFIVFIGDDEIDSGKLTIKDLKLEKQEQIQFADVEDYFSKL